VAHRQRGNHLVISTIEHASVMNSAKTLEKLGFEVSTVPVDKWGLVDPAAVKETLRDDTILVSVMHANPEIGTIEPIADIARVAHERDILFHTDAVMSAGTIPVDVGEMEIDLLSLAGHQFYGPNGGAALFVRKGVRIMPFIDGGIQERGRRAGTEDIPAIVGLGTAAELAQAEMKARAERLIPLRDRLMIGLEESIPHTIVTGHRTRRLPGHVSACFEYVEGEGMMLHLDMMGIAVSSGSTCTSKALKASHVLSAIGIPAATANGSLVITMGEQTVPEDVDAVLEKLPPIVERLRKMSPLYKEI
jgi:cysteine desulfurase